MNLLSSLTTRWMLRIMQIAAVSCLIGLGVGATLVAPRVPASSALPPPVTTAISSEVQQALVAHECSTSGLPSGQVPGSALIRAANGTIKHVSFDRGWAVLESPSSAEKLVAVCRSEMPPAR